MSLLKLVTFTSDFGWQSEACGIMEATVLEICAEARTVHLSHGVVPFNVMDGARELECIVSLGRAIHVCVVDPGVGTWRAPLVLDIPRLGYLIGPDNGVLMPATRMAGGIRAARKIDNPAVIRYPVSSTFHGRDYFASVAGHLANGVAFSDVGSIIPEADLAPAPYNDARIDASLIRATVIHVNRFGNCILNVLSSEIATDDDRIVWRVRSGAAYWTIPHVPAFSFVALGELLLYPDSYGRVGLAVNQGSAAKLMDLKLGSELELKCA
jgi:S-adenosyl-L-methionine hydrolase (adenosine-forming)